MSCKTGIITKNRMRPTSGMNHYIKGKLPDCFLIENSPVLPVRQNTERDSQFGAISSTKSSFIVANQSRVCPQ